jgi:dolichol-phosphate mannosyltransferase
MPAYNEGSYIKLTLARVLKYVESDFECLVIVDSTDDSTIPFVEEFQSIDPRFRIVINDLIPGPAGAIKKGIRTAVGKTVVIVTGDGSDDLQQVDQLYSLIERGVSVAVASRYMKGGQLVGAPFLKSFLSKMAGKSLYYFARIGTKDATNNFKAYSKDLLNSIEIESQHGFEIGLEITTKAKIKKMRIAEIPTIWIERTENESNFPLWKSLPKYLKWYIWAVIRKS